MQMTHMGLYNPGRNQTCRVYE